MNITQEELRDIVHVAISRAFTFWISFAFIIVIVLSGFILCFVGAYYLFKYLLDKYQEHNETLNNILNKYEEIKKIVKKIDKSSENPEKSTVDDKLLNVVK